MKYKGIYTKSYLKLQWFELLELKIIIEAEIDRINELNALPYVKEPIMLDTIERLKQILYLVNKALNTYK